MMKYVFGLAMGSAFMLGGAMALSCGGTLEEAQTAVAKTMGYRDQVCTIPKAIPKSVPGIAEVGEACDRGDDFEAIIKVYACADESRDGNMETARMLEATRLLFCSVAEDPKLDSPEVDAVRKACSLNKNLRGMAKAFVGGCG